MFSKLFLALVAASCVVSGPTISSHPRGPSEVILPTKRKFMPFEVKFNVKAGKPFAQQERERAQRFLENKSTNEKRQDANDTVPAANIVTTFLADLFVGNPPTRFFLVVDTGSSNTWVGANTTKPYRRTSTSRPTNERVSVMYGSGQFNGLEYIDDVSLGPDSLFIKNQSIGVAASTQGFDGVDGIMGLGPAGLTVGTLQNSNTPIPTLVDNLFAQGVIEKPEVGIFFAPTNQSQLTLSGHLTFGGINKDMLTSNVNYAPITRNQPAGQFWGIDQALTYGNTPLLSSAAGIVDTGTTLVLVPTQTFNQYANLTGGTLDPVTGLLQITPTQMNQLKSLFFHIGNETYELTPEAQIFPPFLNTQIGGKEGAVYLVLADLGTSPGSGLDFINGFAFLQRFYSVYDAANHQVGFATTSFTNATSMKFTTL